MRFHTWLFPHTLLLLFKIKPLTDEEKKQKLEELRDKMADKRAKKTSEEANEAKANELIRRKAGKVRTDWTRPLSIQPFTMYTMPCTIDRRPHKPKRI